MANGKTMTAVQAIRAYFFAPDAKATDVIKEIKTLTPEDKTELAAGAAKELNVSLVPA